MRVLVKVGGSVLTDKSKYATPRQEAILRVAREIARSGAEVALVHGAGSFGHILALKLESTSPSYDPRTLATLHRDLRILHLGVLEALLEEGLSPLGIPPFSTPLDSLGRMFERVLESGMLPVTFGDVALGEGGRFRIVSGDDLLLPLSLALRPRLVVVGTDVDGVFTEPPQSPHARLVESLTSRDLRSILAQGSLHPDATGGMGKKLPILSSLASHGIPVLVVNANVPGRLQRALEGAPVLGTRIHG